MASRLSIQQLLNLGPLLVSEQNNKMSLEENQCLLIVQLLEQESPHQLVVDSQSNIVVLKKSNLVFVDTLQVEICS